jgi:acetyltransferase
MLKQTRVFQALQGVRGRRVVNLMALEKLLVRFSHLVVEQRCVKEIDINPLLASSERLLALDARVVLHPSDLQEEQLPKLAIRPHPHQYVAPWTMKDRTQVTLRPIRPEDEPLMVKFHGTLSDRTVYFHYFGALKLSQRVAHERLIRICFQDYERELALVADYKNLDTGEHQIMGVGGLTKTHGTNEAEFAFLVCDECQGKGLGTELVRRLLRVAREETISRVVGYILSKNVEMVRVCEKLGFNLDRSVDDGTMHAVYEL